MTAALRPHARPATFLPGVAPRDPLGHYWLRQVTLNLRRELCWLWQERTGSADSGVPPLSDRVAEALDFSRYAEIRRRFFREDPTARFLTEQLSEAPPRKPRKLQQGSFGWVAAELELTPSGCFVLALGLHPVVDSAAGLIYAACANDASRTLPTLGLAHRLWDAPDELLECFDPAHPLITHGLLTAPPAGWQDPIAVPAVIARHLLGIDGAPEYFGHIPAGRAGLHDDAELAAARLSGGNRSGLRIVPLVGPPGAELSVSAARIGKAIGRPVVSVDREFGLTGWVWTLAWLRGVDLFFPVERGTEDSSDDSLRTLPVGLRRLPLVLYPGLSDPGLVRSLPRALTLPAVTVPPLEYQERLAAWRDALEAAELEPEARASLPNVARRFRVEAEKIRSVSRGITALGRPAATADLVRALSTDLDLGELAQRIVPRFRKRDLMLPAHQSRQLDELMQGMGALATVHYEWGLGRSWNEAGLSALFAGPPGTGKTMAAEVIAGQLDLPLFRIDLSQVVNKYIGETEKNLRRLFDAAESSDVILFFDEAESLFGKRTETKDAHDRYANLEVSYLLGRMERFRGHAILSTNRKKDLDEAFMRRLRFVVDFPLPDVADRLRMWTRMLPRDVDISKLDLGFLAERFPLAGGHIRAIVLHASLQAAAEGERVLTMPVVLRAVRREYEKLERSFGSDQLGRYADALEA